MQNELIPDERDVQRTVLDWLTAHRIWHRRMNSGAMVLEHHGKKRLLRAGSPGMADILATLPFVQGSGNPAQPIWLEIKRPGGRQSDAQREFEREVVAAGHIYAVIQDVNQLAILFQER